MRLLKHLLLTLGFVISVQLFIWGTLLMNLEWYWGVLTVMPFAMYASAIIGHVFGEKK